MRKVIFISLLLILGACDDGDLQIETLDFDSVDPQTCDAIEAGLASVLFKVNNEEALILELPATAIKNEVAEVEAAISTSGNTKVTYRIFDDVVAKDYFCNDIPLGTPLLLEEILAESGTVIITTTTTDNITYNHEISLSEVSLITGSNTRITDLRINSFGRVTTTIMTE